MKKKIFYLLTFLIASNAYASSLKGTADALGDQAVMIGRALGIFAIAVAATYLALGKQEGGQKITQAIFGILIVLMAKTIVTTLSSVAGGA